MWPPVFLFEASFLHPAWARRASGPEGSFGSECSKRDQEELQRVTLRPLVLPLLPIIYRSWDRMNSWPGCHVKQRSLLPWRPGSYLSWGDRNWVGGEGRLWWFTPGIAWPRIYMNVKRGGSRQPLSQTHQKPLKMKDPEHLYISSPGMPVTFRLPTPTAQPRAGQPLPGPGGSDSVLPLAKLGEGRVCPEGGGIWAVLEGAGWGSWGKLISWVP